MLKKITIERFKNLETVTLELEKINVLIGSNNSGKSSILQAIQFSVSAAQTSAIYGKYWKRNGTFSTSVLQEQLIYAPLRNTYALAYNQELSENKQEAIKVHFETEIEEDRNNATILIRKGRNKNLFVNLENRELGEQLQNVDNPFSIYVPGLAGVSHSEEYKTPAIVRKAAARGDSNKVFRNILYLLKLSEEGWNQFENDFKTLFPDSEINIQFNPNRDDFIEVFFKESNHEVPIDLAGTGVLQILQILSYVNFYNPKILLLDEPDAHLHPNNQRKLTSLLKQLVEERNLQVILTTHSRHLLDALSYFAKIFWLKTGNIVGDENFDSIRLLLDLGALDKGELLLNTRQIKCVLLTEDEDTNGIMTLLKASGFNIDEVDCWSYEGCTNVHTAKNLANFIRQHSEHTKILVHRDRDYMNEEEVKAYKNDIEKENIFCFVTEGTDVESHFINSEHIISCLSLDGELNQINDLIEDATNETGEKSRINFVNSRTQIERNKSYNDERRGRVNHGKISESCTKLYGEKPFKYRHGKTVFKCIKLKLQNKYGGNFDLIQATEAIKDLFLENIALRIW